MKHCWKSTNLTYKKEKKMNRLVLSVEIELVIQKLPPKENTTTGPDGVTGEFLLFQEFIPIFHNSFKNRKGRNTFYTSQMSPEEQNQYYI